MRLNTNRLNAVLTSFFALFQVFGQDRLVVDNCGAPCYKLFFGISDISLVRQIVGIAAIISFLSCLFTLVSNCKCHLSK